VAAESSEQTLARLDRVLEGILEPAQRSSLVLEALEARDAAGAYALISAVLGRALALGSAFDVLRDTLHGLLLSSPPEPALDYDRRSEIYEEANSAGDRPSCVRCGRRRPCAAWRTATAGSRASSRTSRSGAAAAWRAAPTCACSRSSLATPTRP